MKPLINFRDFGGYPTLDGQYVKQGYLYRAGRVDTARSRDLAALRAVGIRTLVDLRSEKERNRGVYLKFRTLAESVSLLPPRSSAPLRVVFLPMDFDEITRKRLMPVLFKRNAVAAVFDIIEGVYRDIVDQVCPQLRQLFDILLTVEAYPLLITCQAGRDRTGFVSAVIQLALGVGAEAVVQDYLRSNAYFLPQARRIVMALKIFSLGLFPTHNLRGVFTSQERYIRTVINKIDEDYGGIHRYLAHCHITPSEQDILKTLLLSKNVAMPGVE
ncbi:MAG: tyrosine-protein phosphatase [Anaerolineae bacterium]|nr:tyrosine-protein phosphatase [Anaerolineae bacterium]